MFKIKIKERNLSLKQKLDDIIRVSKTLDDPSTITIDQYNEKGIVSASCIMRHYSKVNGTSKWLDIIEALGFSKARTNSKTSLQDMLENYKNVWVYLKRQPDYTDLRTKKDRENSGSKYSAGVYDYRFGRWSNFLRYFDKYVNKGYSLEQIELEMKFDEIILKKQKKEKTRREITPGIRQNVLLRDKRTCQVCYNNRESDPNLILDVDHIVPLSKGGANDMSNLQTLCRLCHQGKGTRLLDFFDKDGEEEEV